MAGFPEAVGLYDPANEKDACGIGFIADLAGNNTRATVVDAIEVSCCLHTPDLRLQRSHVVSWRL